MTKQVINPCKRVSFIAMAVLFILANSFLFLGSQAHGAEKEKFDNWEAVAERMATILNDAKMNVEKGDRDAAYEDMNDAYFGYYEIQGFEKNVLAYISSDRVGDIEAQFRRIKNQLKGNVEAEDQEILDEIEELKIKVYKDAMVLDSTASEEDPDEVGGKVNTIVTDESEHGKTVSKDYAESSGNSGNKAWNTFLVAFSLLLREGLEAILVIVAIVAYLVKTNNKKLIRHVYMGSLVAILASIVLAVVIQLALGSGNEAGVAREMLEGITMFIAVIVLFYVSNWMLNKSEHENWNRYINEKVQDSIDGRSAKTLVFAAFLAVFREGAELILFYSASFSSGTTSPLHIGLGILAGAVVLAVVFLLIRFTSVKLPLRPFFLATSVLLFLMCISFMGKGVVELAEANVITGTAIIPSLSWLNIEILNIRNTAETLIPQVILVIAALWILIPHLGKKKKPTEDEAQK